MGPQFVEVTRGAQWCWIGRLIKLVFIFVSGHAGVKWHEQADRLAECAIVGNGQAMEIAVILNAIWYSHRDASSFREHESETKETQSHR
jgi:uncharacterized membrane protein